MATKNIVPRTAEEGQIGTTAKKWLKGYFKELYMGSTPAKCSVEGHSHSVATVSAPGFVELATDAETQTGTDTGRVVCPSSLKSAVPFKTTATMNLYVNSGAAYGSWGAGSDSNAGTAAAPFATIAKAISVVPRFIEHSVTISLAGSPNYYEWKPDGTNGILFTTGNSGVTVAVVSGTTLDVAISGSAVTITLATGGSTIAQIIEAINNSATVGAVIFPNAIGTNSTNITATIAAQALIGGNVRTYREAVVLSGFTNQVVIQGAGGSWSTAGVIISPAVATSGIAVGGVKCLIAYITLLADVSGYDAILVNQFGACYASFIRVVGAWGYGLRYFQSKGYVEYVWFFGVGEAVASWNGSFVCVNGAGGAGNNVGLHSSASLISTVACNIGATYARIESPSGSIL